MRWGLPRVGKMRILHVQQQQPNTHTRTHTHTHTHTHTQQQQQQQLLQQHTTRQRERRTRGTTHKSKRNHLGGNVLGCPVTPGGAGLHLHLGVQVVDPVHASRHRYLPACVWRRRRWRLRWFNGLRGTESGRQGTVDRVARVEEGDRETSGCSITRQPAPPAFLSFHLP